MRACVLLVGIAAFGCARPIEAELLALRRVGPDRIGSGHRLLLEGDGFPVGRRARVTLDGTLHRPGCGPRQVQVQLEGEAIDERRVEVPMPEATLRAIGGRGTFRGAARVAFGAGALDASVVGRAEGITIDFVPTSAPAAAGRPIADAIGIEVMHDDDPDTTGLLVRSVADGSSAAEAGLVPGDRIVAADGVRLLGLQDLLAPPEARDVELEIARARERRTFVVLVDLPPTGLASAERAGRIVQLAVLVWLVALLWLGPGAALVERLAPRAGTRLDWALLLPFGAIALGIRHVLALCPALGLEAVVLACVAGRSVLAWLEASGPRQRLGALARSAAAAIAALGALGAAAVALGTTASTTPAFAQGSWPIEWLGFRNPAGVLALALVLVAAACGPLLEPGARRGVRLFDDAFVVALAASATIALAGGRSAVLRLADERSVFASLPFALTSGTLALLLRRARDHGAGAGAGVLLGIAVALTALGLAVALAWNELDVPPDLERAVGEVVAVAVLLFAIRVATARPPRCTTPQSLLL